MLDTCNATGCGIKLILSVAHTDSHTHTRSSLTQINCAFRVKLTENGKKLGEFRGQRRQPATITTATIIIKEKREKNWLAAA